MTNEQMLAAILKIMRESNGDWGEEYVLNPSDAEQHHCACSLCDRLRGLHRQYPEQYDTVAKSALVLNELSQ